VRIGNSEEVGNAYIFDNMSDEEKRLADEQKSSAVSRDPDVIPTEAEGSERKPRKVAEITKVEFLDKDGKKKNVFETGDDLSIRVYFKAAADDIDKLNFGVALFNQENNYIFGINTLLDRKDTSKYRNLGYFQVDYKVIPLKTNSYFIKANIFGENDLKAYDFLEKSISFKVVSMNNNQGAVELIYSWN